MDFKGLIDAIFEGILRFMPLFRVMWVVTAGIGLIMMIIALVLKRTPARKKSPWIVGCIGLLVMLSSGTQLIASFF